MNKEGWGNEGKWERWSISEERVDVLVAKAEFIVRAVRQFSAEIKDQVASFFLARARAEEARFNDADTHITYSVNGVHF